MSHTKLRKTGFTAAVFAGSALLMATLGLPAQAAPAGGAMKLVGVSASQELKFASCMRRHGVPSFPDPNANGFFPVSQNIVIPPGAQTFCTHLLHLPGAPTPAEIAKFTEQAIVFAKCMHSHGVPNFPEPGAQGGTSISHTTGNSPFFQRAEQACRKFAPDGQVPTPVP